jgi:hypothetical protein
MSTLAEYLAAVRTPSDLAKPPPADLAGVAKPDWHWANVAETAADQALERWAWALTQFGRPVVVRAARSMLGHMLPVWDAAAAKPGPGITTCLENIERGFDPSPQRLHDDIQGWLDAASDARDARAAALSEATQGERLDLFDAIGNEEFKDLWGQDPWMFVLTGAYAAAMTVYDTEDQVARALGNVAVSCRLATAPTVKAAAAIGTWRALSAALIGTDR